MTVSIDLPSVPTPEQLLGSQISKRPELNAEARYTESSGYTARCKLENSLYPNPGKRLCASAGRSVGIQNAIDQRIGTGICALENPLNV